MKRTTLRPLGENSAKLKNPDFCTVDIEANDWIDFEMAGFYDGQNYRYCNSISVLLDACFTIRDTIHTRLVFAHFGGNYDFQFLIGEIRERGFYPQLTIINGKLAQITVRITKRNKISFRDSSCILNSSLDKLCKAFDTKTKKLTGTIDFAKERVDKNNSQHRLYLENDCISLFEIIEKYFSLDIVKDCNKKLTTASQAMEVFRRHFLIEPVKTTTQEIQDFCRQGYYGGRVEIFKQENFDYKIYDCNSLYPHCMVQTLPIEHIGSSNDVDKCGYYDVEIESPGLDVPILPVRHKVEDTEKLIFPNGRFRGVFYSEELKQAQIFGYKIIKLYRGEKFTESNTFFKNYVDHWYNLRLANPEGPLNYTAKLFLNSLYGKFSQREEVEGLKYFAGEENYEPWGSPEIFEKFGLIKETKFRRESYMLVHIGAAVTAWGRITLNRQLQAYNPFYCDTDSIHTKDILRTGKALGEWKDETLAYGGAIKRGFYRAPKMYYLEANNGEKYIRGKGFPAKYLKTLDYDYFKNNALNYSENKFLKFKSAIKRNKSYLGTSVQIKTIKAKYDKRFLFTDGNTRAWVINNGEIK